MRVWLIRRDIGMIVLSDKRIGIQCAFVECTMRDNELSRAVVLFLEHLRLESSWNDDCKSLEALVSQYAIESDIIDQDLLS